MKRILCAILACLLLCACASAPVLKEGWYLAPLEESGGSPMYYCLEAGGTGYVHAMGEDIPITWTSDGIDGMFGDGAVVTEEGIEFPDGIVYPYSAELPEEYTQSVLRPGFYIPEGGEFDSLMCYAELREDGTGEFSILGMARPIEWEPTKFYFGDMIVCATETGFSMTDSVTSHFRWVGDELPEGYLPDPPAPGTYYISSVGYQGDMSLFGAPDPDRNGLVLNDDGTGVFAFRGEEYPLTWEGSIARLEGGYSLMLVDMGDQGEDPPLVFGYVMEAECPIEADSIAFRLLEGE